MTSPSPSPAPDTALWLKPLQLGELNLKNRFVFAPCTRNRGNVPGRAQVEYYTQRASAGLIVSEGTLPVPQGYEFGNAPGLYNSEQVAGWKTVTDSVHAAGGLIVTQLMNIGRVAHPMLQSGQHNYGPSAIAATGGRGFRQLHNQRWVSSTPEQEVIDVAEQAFWVKPVAIADPWERVAEYKAAAQRAKDAGFDGVELHGANGYLVAQFLDSGANQRTDEWGGSAQKRCKFALEVLRALIDVWGSGRVGIKLTPEGGYQDMGMSSSETLETYGHLLAEIAKLNLAYVHVQRWTPLFDPAKRGTILPENIWRTLYPQGNLLLNNSYTPEEGLALIASGGADAILFGRLFLANPDLPHRILHGHPLSTGDYSTWFGSPAGQPLSVGYSDYKRWDELSAEERTKASEEWAAYLAQHKQGTESKEKLLQEQQIKEKELSLAPLAITPAPQLVQ